MAQRTKKDIEQNRKLLLYGSIFVIIVCILFYFSMQPSKEDLKKRELISNDLVYMMNNVDIIKDIGMSEDKDISLVVITVDDYWYDFQEHEKTRLTKEISKNVAYIYQEHRMSKAPLINIVDEYGEVLKRY